MMVQDWAGIRPECEGGESFQDYDGTWVSAWCHEPARFEVTCAADYEVVMACSAHALGGAFGPGTVRVLSDADLSAYVRGVIDAAWRELTTEQLYAIGWGEDDGVPYEPGAPYEAGWNALLAVRVNHLVGNDG